MDALLDHLPPSLSCFFILLFLWAWMQLQTTLHTKKRSDTLCLSFLAQFFPRRKERATTEGKENRIIGT